VARWFPSKLYHAVPGWVEDGATFHIRIALDRRTKQRPLTDPALAKALIESAKFYHGRQRWVITVLTLMPDHLHALLSFDRDKSMSRVIGDWKHYHSHHHKIVWQKGYFDHRLRDDERGDQMSGKITYMRNNPVAAGLCSRAEDWPWWIERSALDEGGATGRQVDSMTSAPQ
jgi:putative transposase